MHDKISELNKKLLVQNTLFKEKEDRNIEKIELLERRIQAIAENAAIEKSKRKGPKPLPFQKYYQSRSSSKMSGISEKKLKKSGSKKSMKRSSSKRKSRPEPLPRVATMVQSDSKSCNESVQLKLTKSP